MRKRARSALPAIPAAVGTERLTYHLFARRWWPVALTLFLVGPALGYLVYRMSRASGDEETRALFESHVSKEALHLERQLLAYVEVLHAVRAHFYASTEVTRDEFKTFVRESLDRFPAIQAIEWIPRVTPETLDRHVRAGREAGLLQYGVRSIAPGAPASPSARIRECYPVFYVEPMEGNERAVGIDLLSEPTRARCVAEALRAGGAVFCDPIRLVQEEASSWGFLAVLPVYGQATPGVLPVTDEVKGLVAVVFRAQDLGRGAFAETEDAAEPLMAFRLRVGREGLKRVIVYDARSRLESAVPADAMAVTERVEVAGLTWSLVAWPTHAFLGGQPGSRAVLLGLVVFLGWEVLVGTLMTLLRSGHDLSARRQADVVRSALHGLGEGVILADQHGRVRFANPAAERLVGASSHGAGARPWEPTHQFFAEDGATPVESPDLPLWRAIRGEAVADETLVLRPGDGSEDRVLSMAAAPLKGEEGEPTGGVTVLRDVTAHRASEERAQRLASAVEQAADAILVADRQGHIRYVNSAFLETTGYALHDVLGKSPLFLKGDPASEDVYRNLWTTVLQGEPYRGTMVNRRKNGELYHAEQTVTPVRGDDGTVTHYVSVSRDVTEQVQLREREVEMRLAASIQQRLYPHDAPRLEGIDLAGQVFSAEATCGDYFDYIERPQGGWVLSVGDVCGHGFGPALVMAQTRALVRSLLEAGRDLPAVLELTNRYLCRDTADGLFVTMILVQLDPATRALRWTNAGHPSAYLLAPERGLETAFDTTGPALGLFEEAEFPERSGATLQAGDTLLLLTDGAFEIRSPEGEVFGLDRLLAVARANPDASAEGLIGHLRRALRAFGGTGAQEDDITFVVCRGR